MARPRGCKAGLQALKEHACTEVSWDRRVCAFSLIFSSVAFISSSWGQEFTMLNSDTIASLKR